MARLIENGTLDYTCPLPNSDVWFIYNWSPGQEQPCAPSWTSCVFHIQISLQTKQKQAINLGLYQPVNNLLQAAGWSNGPSYPQAACPWAPGCFMVQLKEESVTGIKPTEHFCCLGPCLVEMLHYAVMESTHLYGHYKNLGYHVRWRLFSSDHGLNLSSPSGRFDHKYGELWAGCITIAAQTQHFQSMHKKTYLKE